MSANTWSVIPTANILSNLSPEDNPAINPTYPTPVGFGGSGALVSAWNGAALDRATDTLWLPLQRGHSDGAGNEPYKIRLDTDAPEFVMLRYPSGAVGNVLTLNDGQEASGTYSDGRPRAVHSYNKPLYVPGLGPMMSIHGSSMAFAANGTSAKALLLDETTGETTYLADNPYAGMAGGSDYGGSAHDPSRNCNYYLPSYNGALLTKYDIAGNSWSQVGGSVGSASSAMCYMPEHDCLLVLCASFASGIGIYDCATAAWTYPSTTGSVVGMSSLLTGTYGAKSPTWVPRLGAAALWDNATDTTLISTLVAPTDPRTGVWEMFQLPISVSNAVTPTARTPNGTYGRFQYSPRLHGFYLLNASDQQPYFYSLD